MINMPKNRNELREEPPEMILLTFARDIPQEGPVLEETNLHLIDIFGAFIDIDWRDSRTVEITNHGTKVVVTRKYH